MSLLLLLPAPRVVPLPFTEAFTGADQSGFGGNPWTLTDHASIVSGKGRLQPTDTLQYASAGANLGGLTVATDVDVTFTTTTPASAPTTHMMLSLGAPVGGSYTGFGAAGGYSLSLYDMQAGVSGYYLERMVSGGSPTQLGPGYTYLGGTVSPGAPIGLRFQRIGTTIRFKVWAAASAEPSGWTATVVDDTGPQPEGIVTFGLQNPTTTYGTAYADLDDITVSVPVAFTATPQTSGSGSLSLGAPRVDSISVPVLLGSGTLTSAALPNTPSIPALSGSGTLIPISAPNTPGVSALSGFGVLSVTPTVKAIGAATFAGSGVLNIAAFAVAPGVATLSGSGTVDIAALPNVSLPPQFTGSGSLQVSPTVRSTGIATFSGSGTVTSSPKPVVAFTTAFSGAGVLNIVGAPLSIVSLQLAGSGALSLTAAPNAPGTAILSGAGQVAAAAEKPTVSGIPQFASNGTLATATTITATGGTALTGSGVLRHFGGFYLAGDFESGADGWKTGTDEATFLPVQILDGQGMPVTGNGGAHSGGTMYRHSAAATGTFAVALTVLGLTAGVRYTATIWVRGVSADHPAARATLGVTGFSAVGVTPDSTQWQQLQFIWTARFAQETLTVGTSFSDDSGLGGAYYDDWAVTEATSLPVPALLVTPSFTGSGGVAASATLAPTGNPDLSGTGLLSLEATSDLDGGIPAFTGDGALEVVATEATESAETTAELSVNADLTADAGAFEEAETTAEVGVHTRLAFYRDLPYTYSFTGADGDPWAAEWDGYHDPDIQGSRGRFLVSNWHDTGSRVFDLPPDADDVSLVLDFSAAFAAFLNGAGGQGDYIELDLQITAPAADNETLNAAAYALGLEYGQPPWVASFIGDGTFHRGAFTTLAGLDFTQPLRVRISEAGTGRNLRVWQDGSPEPVEWTLANEVPGAWTGPRWVDLYASRFFDGDRDGSTDLFVDDLTVRASSAIEDTDTTGTNAVTATLTGEARTDAAEQAALPGSGTLATAAAATVPGGIALSGSGALTTPAVPSVHGSAALSSLGSLALASTVTATGNAALAGSGALSAGVLPSAVSTGAITASVGTSASASTETATTGTVRNNAAISASAAVTGATTAAASANVRLTATASTETATTGTLSAAATLAATASTETTTTGSITTTLRLSGSTATTAVATGQVGVNAALTATAVTVPIASSTGTVTVTAAVGAAATTTGATAAPISATAAVSATASSTVASTGTVTVRAAITAAAITETASTGQVGANTAVSAAAIPGAPVTATVTLTATATTEYVTAVAVGVNAAIRATASSVGATEGVASIDASVTGSAAVEADIAVSVGVSATASNVLYRDTRFAILDMYGNPLRIGATLPGDRLYAQGESKQVGASTAGLTVTMRGNPLKVNGQF